jgi:hypothetical protein
MWQTSFINTMVLAVVFSLRSSCQSDIPKVTISSGDTIQFTIQQVLLDTTNTHIAYTEVHPKLMYDFGFQYPYYQTDGKKWKMGDQMQFNFSQLPSKGFLYIFSVDGTNTPEILPVINLDSTLKLPLVYPDKAKALTFKVSGTERICIWYATKPIPNVEKLIMGIELTMGSFVNRNNGQLGNKLVLPSSGWHLIDKQYGFTTNASNFQFTDNNVLPLIIECEVATATADSSMRKSDGTGKVSTLVPIKKKKQLHKVIKK